MSEQEIWEKIARIQKRIQDMADRETQAAWSKFFGVTSYAIEQITNGSFTEEKMRLIQAIDRLLSDLEEKG